MNLNKLFKSILISISLTGFMYNSFSDINTDEDLYSFNNIRQMPYMGGSLVFNSNNSSLSHIYSGIRIPIRFGKYTKIQIPTNDIPEEYQSKAATDPVYTYEEDETEIKYGTITINSISVNSLYYSYIVFNNSAIILKNGSGTLSLGSQADLDSDGKPDIEYVQSISANRTPNSDISYLRFISSESDLYSTMYCYAKDIFSSFNDAGGNLGYNSNGAAILKPQGQGLAKSFGTGISIEPGDIVIDNGNYYRVNKSLSRLAKQSSMTSISAINNSEPVTDYSEIIPQYAMNITNLSNSGLGKVAATSNTVTAEEYASKYAAYKTKLDKCKWKKNLFNTSFAYDAGSYKIGLLNYSMDVGVGANFKVSWDHAKGDVYAMFLSDMYLGIEAKNSDISINERKVLWSEYFSTSFTIWVLIIDLGISPNIGYEAELALKATRPKVGIRCCDVYDATVSIDAKWTGVKSSKSFSHDKFIYPDFNLSTTVGSTCRIMPFIGIDGMITIEKCLYAVIPATLKIGPIVTTSWSSTIPNTVNLDAKVILNANIGLEAGIGIELKKWGITFRKKWTPIKVNLYNQDWVLWNWATSLTPISGPDGTTLINTNTEMNPNPVLLYNNKLTIIPIINNLLLD